MQDCPRGLGAIPGGGGNTDELEHDSIFSKKPTQQKHSKTQQKTQQKYSKKQHRRA